MNYSTFSINRKYGQKVNANQTGLSDSGNLLQIYRTTVMYYRILQQRDDHLVTRIQL